MILLNNTYTFGIILQLAALETGITLAPRFRGPIDVLTAQVWSTIPRRTFTRAAIFRPGRDSTSV